MRRTANGLSEARGEAASEVAAGCTGEAAVVERPDEAAAGCVTDGAGDVDHTGSPHSQSPAGAGASRPSMRGSVLRAAVVLLTFLAVFQLRSYLVGGTHVDFSYVDTPVVYQSSTLTRFMTYLHIHWQYAKLLVLPWHLSWDYSYDAVPMVSEVEDLRNLGTLALYAGLVGGIYAAAREYVTKGRFQLLLAIAWILITFLPAANLFFTVGTVVGERLLYIPSVGWAAVVPYLVAAAVTRTRPAQATSAGDPDAATASGAGVALVAPSASPGRAAVPASSRAWLIALTLLAFYMYNSGHRTHMWRSRVTLFGGDARSYRRSAKTLHQFATTLHRTGHLEEARGLYEASLAVFDDNALTDYCIAQIDLERNKFEIAYDRFVKIANGHGIGFGGFNRFLLLVDFGFACVALGHHDQAVPLLEEGLGLNLDVPHGLNALAIAYAHLGELDKATEKLTTGLRYDPGNVWLYNNLAAMALVTGNLELAVSAVNKAIELSPGFFGGAHPKIARNAEIAGKVMKGEAVNGPPEIELFFHRMI